MSDEISTDVFVCDVCGMPIETPVHIIPPQDVTVEHYGPDTHGIRVKTRPFTLRTDDQG